ncbi:MAG: nuclear transport factor 2 family protein [Streptococcaceae bacterium]|jgi:ketosteroid isomerase-like protein|nr:nuclear transport factor 2 family protein [Streptococcaceae bacterium]MCH4176917.1 nuclear transport factor 2 family protein [Streptococcaceae bacterium]
MKAIIKAYEARLRKAMLNSDVEELNQLLSENLKFVNHFGQVVTKADDIKSHQTGEFSMTSIEIKSQDLYISDGAIITISDVELEVVIASQASSDHLIYTRVWQKIGNDWQVIRGQATQV